MSKTSGGFVNKGGFVLGIGLICNRWKRRPGNFIVATQCTVKLTFTEIYKQVGFSKMSKTSGGFCKQGGFVLGIGLISFYLHKTSSIQ